MPAGAGKGVSLGAGRLLELEDDDAGVGAFEAGLLDGVLGGGCKHGIATENFTLTDAAGSVELELETDNSDDLHAAGEFGIGDPDFGAFGFAERFLGE
jgi:hypothetical protein